ncbi:hypothetical protein [Nitrobacter winogradskyi]|uniref:Uncharacterized protein n=2 Tax=Nitrobacter winogradskyi TaxID=913 RepID=A0ACC6ADI7_NITWI|nr:hypothetical protein [Nitrobacter winogradskyi]MCP1997875.1 hypothetical protein [Nitrobacter winogradskyi]GEC17544.1 hypothetical protein NWI01_34360 [Nitrobacter winogradskyi]
MTTTATMTTEQHQEAGRSHLEYMRELLETQGDDAKLELRACHMRSILAATQTQMIQSA